ncbi:MAG: hypoxanthine phosphoribosyltransferase [Bacteroidales bacterium]|nr:hypoxanthine phosphoribosyltransferase [Bacteroidales bacterium]MDD4001187.1 hypoxanthine phosphoribosyltransferase [Bacteroidales bacterium]MDD4528597.1 hypoxanthine phosphoribosyltransferase [Bacteroidales bacterium]MDD4828963.1 hypoxanthine phosphoribosyltransferase [Bacteroidales bacterium]
METVNIKGKYFEKYITNEEINSIVKSLSQRINEDYFGKEIYFLVILNGAFLFASDLFKQIKGLPRINFIKVSSYSGISSSGKVNELIGLNEDITGKDVIIIEDIVDTGNTMEELLKLLKTKEPSSLEICSLMLKPNSFKKDFNIKYIGKEISDEFIVGYGFDLDGYGRNLKDIYQLKRKADK